MWTGWWGDDPPFHHPVFVLTHHAHPSIPMQGGTTFHFVTDGIETALERAFEAADGQDVRIGGGAPTIQQYLRADLIDEMHLAISPILLGGGERLFDTSTVAWMATSASSSSAHLLPRTPACPERREASQTRRPAPWSSARHRARAGLDDQPAMSSRSTVSLTG
jgi:dihydrofolate reductase